MVAALIDHDQRSLTRDCNDRCLVVDMVSGVQVMRMARFTHEYTMYNTRQRATADQIADQQQ
jgi:hypothetical protein